MSAARANQEIYKLLKDGVRISYRAGGDEDETFETVTVIDWNDPGNNDFSAGLAVLDLRRVWQEARRPGRLRQRHPTSLHRTESLAQALELAYEKNLSDYKTTSRSSSGTTR